MGNKEVATRLLLAVATAGLTTCGVGAVDPAPEPLNCEDVAKGDDLSITGVKNGDYLTMTMNNATYNASWKENPTVTAVSGLTIDSVSKAKDSSDIEILATLDAGATSASFTVAGTMSDGDVDCATSRTFNVAVDAMGEVEITELFDLPISPRRHAAIEMLGREGMEVTLRASGAESAPVTWTPTGGTITRGADGQARWTLPSEPGVYQVEMLIDHGESGFSLDTLTLEVLG